MSKKPRVLLRGSLTTLEKTDHTCDFPRFSAGRKGKGFGRISSAFVRTDGRGKQRLALRRKNKVSSRERAETMSPSEEAQAQGEGLALETRRCRIRKMTDEKKR